MMDLYAPIIPFVGIGGIKLYSKISELTEILCGKNVKRTDLNNGWIRYDIDNSISLFFLKSNEKLFKITTLRNYKGKLFEKIGVETLENEFLSVEPSFEYDDFEEVFESNKGVYIETDAIKHTATWISVYIKELLDEDFELGNW